MELTTYTAIGNVEGGSQSLKKERRRMAVKLAAAGHDLRRTAEICELSLQELEMLMEFYARDGWKGVELLNKAVRSVRRKLTQDQEYVLRRMLITSVPEEHGIDPVPWNQGLVHDLVTKHTGVRLSGTGLRSYLTRWGMVPKKPLMKAYGSDPERVRTWMKREFPGIAAKARAGNAEIHWSGTSPIIDQDGTEREMLFVVNNKGYLQWTVARSPLTRADVDALLGRLAHNRERGLVLIAGAHPVFDHLCKSDVEPAAPIHRVIVPPFMQHHDIS